jgi:flagellar hook assembly protein FlgD
VRQYSLRSNYPNPFNPSTAISYSLEKAGDVKLKIYDVLGREVATLVNGKNDAGDHTVIWNARSVPSGVYFYKITAESYIQTKKMILMK